MGGRRNEGEGMGNEKRGEWAKSLPVDERKME